VLAVLRVSRPPQIPEFQAHPVRSALFNASVVTYDPYKQKVVDTITFEGITHNEKLHIGGVAADPYTNLVTIVVDDAAPFATRGKDVSGDNWIIKYDPDKKSVVWRLNITTYTGGKYGGFQDIETDSRGNTYIVGTFPGTILKVDKAGTAVTPWFVPAEINSTRTGYSGLAAVGDVLLANDGNARELHRFDLTADKGTPTKVNLSPATAPFTAGDAIYFPPKWGSKVLLAADPSKGVTVLRSKDGLWKEAENLGVIPLNVTVAGQGSAVPAAVQVGPDNVFMVIEYFGDARVAGTTAGNRTSFPLVDITKEVNALLEAPFPVPPSLPTV